MKDDCESVPIHYSRSPVPTRREKIQISLSTAKQNTHTQKRSFVFFFWVSRSAFVCGVEFVKWSQHLNSNLVLSYCVCLCVSVFDTHCNVIRLEDGLPSRQKIARFGILINGWNAVQRFLYQLWLDLGFLFLDSFGIFGARFFFSFSSIVSVDFWRTRTSRLYGRLRDDEVQGTANVCSRSGQASRQCCWDHSSSRESQLKEWPDNTKRWVKFMRMSNTNKNHQIFLAQCRFFFFGLWLAVPPPVGGRYCLLWQQCHAVRNDFFPWRPPDSARAKKQTKQNKSWK